MMYAYVKFHHIGLFKSEKTELNALGKHKSGDVQHSVKTRSENDTDTAEMVLYCNFVSGLFTKA